MERLPQKSCLSRLQIGSFLSPVFFEKSQDNDGRFLMVNQVCFPLLTRMSMFVEDISRFAPQILSEIAHLSKGIDLRGLYVEILWDTYFVMWSTYKVYSMYVYIIYILFSENHIWTRTTATTQWSRQEWSCRGCSAKCGGSMRRREGRFLGFLRSPNSQMISWCGLFLEPMKDNGIHVIHTSNNYCIYIVHISAYFLSHALQNALFSCWYIYIYM